jgi:hypothetical protein
MMSALGFRLIQAECGLVKNVRVEIAVRHFYYHLDYVLCSSA